MNLEGPCDEQPTNDGQNNSFIVRTSSMNADNNKSSPSEPSSAEAASGLDKKLPPEIQAPPPPTPQPPPPHSKAPPPSPPPHPKAPLPPPIVPIPPPKPIPGKKQPSPLGPHRQARSGRGEPDDQSGKTKLKPLFWDKVLASPDHAIVWNEIRAGSFQ